MLIGGYFDATRKRGLISDDWKRPDTANSPARRAAGPRSAGPNRAVLAARREAAQQAAALHAAEL